jgi:hypothetical protein
MNYHEDKRETHVIPCDCNSHRIEIDYVVEHWENEDGSTVYNKCYEVAVWELLGNSPLRFSERIRWCWRILKTGMPWCDMVIITKEKAEELAKFINNNVDK